jgi:5-methylcytosine-specific restriction endonuclease McrA
LPGFYGAVRYHRQREEDTMGWLEARKERKTEQRAQIRATLKAKRREQLRRVAECEGIGTVTYGRQWSRKAHRYNNGSSFRGPERSPDCSLSREVFATDQSEFHPTWDELKAEGWDAHPRWGAKCPACQALETRLIAEDKKQRTTAARQREAAAKLRTEARRRTHNHVRRSRELQAPGEHSTAEWLLKLEEFGHKCAYCGTEGADFHRDHLVPLVDGGSNTIGNIVPACPACNLSKGGKSGAALLLWITDRGRR